MNSSLGPGLGAHPNNKFQIELNLYKYQAHLCVLASNCDELVYVKMVEALCAKHQIHVIKVDDKYQGEWVGLCKMDREGKPCKDNGKESQAKDVIEEYFKCKK
ncbi:unnamed protein product [Nyctereutes procyonoides]|uniref:40S ribosomal protein S12 n=1 Tax=Nyctereutes procyonoides TaxID=34880 RepID=A0A811Y6I6_NYCPR|nr:unnamed protein product [Nyctereutes procyonoides]